MQSERKVWKHAGEIVKNPDAAQRQQLQRRKGNEKSSAMPDNSRKMEDIKKK